MCAHECQYGEPDGLGVSSVMRAQGDARVRIWLHMDWRAQWEGAGGADAADDRVDRKETDRAGVYMAWVEQANGLDTMDRRCEDEGEIAMTGEAE